MKWLVLGLIACSFSCPEYDRLKQEDPLTFSEMQKLNVFIEQSQRVFEDVVIMNNEFKDRKVINSSDIAQYVETYQSLKESLHKEVEKYKFKTFAQESLNLVEESLQTYLDLDMYNIQIAKDPYIDYKAVFNTFKTLNDMKHIICME